MIQMSLEFELERAEIPLEYERVFVSFLKAACSGYSEEMFNELYGGNKPVIKTYTFSVCLPGAEFDSDIIRLKNNRIKMSFSSCDMGHTIEWFNAFQLMKFKKYPMNRNFMKLVSIRTYNCRQVTEQEIVIKMQSSLVVRKHDIEKIPMNILHIITRIFKCFKRKHRVFPEENGIRYFNRGIQHYSNQSQKNCCDMFRKKD